MAEDIIIKAKVEVDGAEYRALSYSLREAVFDVGTLSCRIVQEDETVAAPKTGPLIGKKAILTLDRTDGQSRQFVGKVIGATRASEEDGADSVTLEIAPDMWRLGKRSNCRMFRGKAVPAIVKEVLIDAGVIASKQDWNTTGSYSTRETVTQYRETDLAFVMRLLSEEGIYFAIVHQDGEDHVEFGDDPAGLGSIAGKTSLPFRDVFGFHVVEDAVMRVEQAVEVRSDKASLRDFSPKKPKLKLDSQSEGTDPDMHVLEVYDYPGRFEDKSVGDRLAKVLVQSMQAERNVIRGESGSLALIPGKTFSIEGHPYAPLNQQLLVTEVSIEGVDKARFRGKTKGRESGYGCRFTAIPTKSSPYVPPRLPRARTIPGLQTAFTTGPSGEEIHTDESAQVKAKFHWDRQAKTDETASRWMRTSQIPTGGAMLLPRMNWEVSVRYLEGDADQPVVMARLYNTATPPPYALPANKARSSVQTATTPGGGSSNELRMDDSGGKEEMFFNASYDMAIDVGNCTTESVGNDQIRQVGTNHTLNVTNSVSTNIGADQTVNVAGNQTENVQTMMVDSVAGSQSLSIGGNRNMQIGGDHRREVTADSTLNVNANMIDLVVGSVTEHTLGKYQHQVGAALVEMTAKNHALCVAGSMTETTGAVKIKGSLADVGVQIGGAMMHRVAGAIINKVTGNRVESSKAALTEIAAGAHLVKAKTVSYEAETALTITMGASILSLTPATVTVLGVSTKLDGPVSDDGVLVMDN